MSTISKSMDSTRRTWARPFRPYEENFLTGVGLAAGAWFICVGALGHLWYLILAGSCLSAMSLSCLSAVSLGLLADKGKNAWDRSQMGIEFQLSKIDKRGDPNAEGNLHIGNQDL